MQWSNHFPDSCPPNDADCKSITVYRFLGDNEIKSEHFLTVRELYPKRKFPETEKECRACSLSVLVSRDEAIRLQKTIPNYMKKSIAEGKLEESSGKIKHTPSAGKNDSSHHSWWVPSDVKPWTLFQEIIEPPQSA
ncbi:hypothetical protein [Pseudanabaena sp. Chao 1811]|uniref:hypothetical protein n=1 Tax=Pseudanabaena sp. Chao 1811 TaxID=2963092 RepID=UPI0022F39F5B|nr:hypothetical protein [Pseudanabaena sp. Chao 1811]